MDDIALKLVNFFDTALDETTHSRNITFLDNVVKRATNVLAVPQLQEDPQLTEADLLEIRDICSLIENGLGVQSELSETAANEKIKVAVRKIEALPALLSKVADFFLRGNPILDQTAASLKREALKTEDVIAVAVQQEDNDTLLNYFSHLIDIPAEKIPSKQDDPFQRNRALIAFKKVVAFRLPDKDSTEFFGESPITKNLRSQADKLKDIVSINCDDIMKIDTLTAKLTEILAGEPAADRAPNVFDFTAKKKPNGLVSHIINGGATVMQLRFPSRGKTKAANQIQKPLL